MQILEGSWFDPLPAEAVGMCNLIISNPPYVATIDPLPAVVRDWEPHNALYAGRDGLDDIRRIIPGALQWLAPEGALVLEVGERHIDLVVGLALEYGYSKVTRHKDLAARERAVVCRR